MSSEQPQSPYAAPLVNRDEEHLNLLSILHYVFAGLAALGSCVPGIYIFIGAIFIAAPQTGKNPPPPMLGWIMIGVGVCVMLVGWGIAALIAYSGRSLSVRRRQTLSFVVACIMLLSFPLGTALGVFTIVVLSRPSVRALYQQTT